jgi:uncharacterized Zn finger protein (UPF0148 family)
MNSDGYRRADDVDPSPYQYPPGVPCDKCGRPLSRYNGYTTCGPCRYRIATDIVDDYYEDEPEKPDSWRDREPIFSLERFKRRKPIPRDETLTEAED